MHVARVDAIVRPWAGHKDLIAVVEKAREALATHPQFRGRAGGPSTKRNSGPEWAGPGMRLVWSTSMFS